MSGRLLTEREELLPILPLRTFNLETDSACFCAGDSVRQHIKRQHFLHETIKVTHKAELILLKCSLDKINMTQNVNGV